MSFLLRHKASHTLGGIFLLLFFCSGFQLSDQAGRASQSEPSEGQHVQDFLEYWGAARLLVTGHNPYSPEQLLELQRSVVTDKKRPLMMYNPPWTLFFLLPFGFIKISTAWPLWLTVNTACLLLSAAQLWRLYGGASSYNRLAWLVCFSVFPTYLVLYLSQITPLALLGITAFLYFQERERWWLAGIVLPLVAIKPHLASLFWIALVASAFRKGLWQPIASGVIAGTVAALVPLLYSPSIFQDYLRLVSELEPPSRWATPTLGKVLGLVLGADALWVSHLPFFAGLGWFAFYWKRYRDNWDWTEQMPLLLLVSQATSVFAWTFDQIILLPALIEGTIWGIRGGSFRIIVFASIVFILINLPQLLRFNRLLFSNEFWLFWMVPVFLLVYSIFKSKTAPPNSSQTPG